MGSAAYQRRSIDRRINERANQRFTADKAQLIEARNGENLEKGIEEDQYTSKELRGDGGGRRMKRNSDCPQRSKR
jgi:hypothetical protein